MDDSDSMNFLKTAEDNSNRWLLNLPGMLLDQILTEKKSGKFDGRKELG